MVRTHLYLLLGLISLLTACQNSGNLPSRTSSRAHPVVESQVGVASIYRDRRTASGERFNAAALTAAHRHWPMGSRVRVTHLRTGRHTTVRINDRGPFCRGRIIDLTPAAASAIGLTRTQGIARVKIEKLNQP